VPLAVTVAIKLILDKRPMVACSRVSSCVSWLFCTSAVSHSSSSGTQPSSTAAFPNVASEFGCGLRGIQILNGFSKLDGDVDVKTTGDCSSCEGVDWGPRGEAGDEERFPGERAGTGGMKGERTVGPVGKGEMD
jgi:hypothetical protein